MVHAGIGRLGELVSDWIAAMLKYRDGEWYVFKERTTKPFERFRTDAVRGLLVGFQAIFATHEWRGYSCYISSLGAEGILTYEPGTITIRVRVTSFAGLLIKNKILSDVESITLDVSGVPSATNSDVFIVHGHGEVARLQLKKLLFDLDLNPIVLQEQDDHGMTIIEKFEYSARTCSFAFVLMTPDDQTVGVSGTESQWRARQNVIMELGWFMAHLGGERVVILYNGRTEIPSDILGVVYVEFKDSVLDAADRIRLALTRVELLGGNRLSVPDRLVSTRLSDASANRR